MKVLCLELELLTPTSIEVVCPRLYTTPFTRGHTKPYEVGCVGKCTQARDAFFIPSIFYLLYLCRVSISLIKATSAQNCLVKE